MSDRIKLNVLDSNVHENGKGCLLLSEIESGCVRLTMSNEDDAVFAHIDIYLKQWMKIVDEAESLFNDAETRGHAIVRSTTFYLDGSMIRVSDKTDDSEKIVYCTLERTLAAKAVTITFLYYNNDDDLCVLVLGEKSFKLLMLALKQMIIMSDF